MTLPEYLPGLPVYRSTDFLTWEHIGNVATAEPDGCFWSVETAALFTGRVVGRFAELGAVHFADFGYHGTGLT